LTKPEKSTEADHESSASEDGEADDVAPSARSGLSRSAAAVANSKMKVFTSRLDEPEDVDTKAAESSNRKSHRRKEVATPILNSVSLQNLVSILLFSYLFLEGHQV
jgi:hypothetical protein